MFVSSRPKPVMDNDGTSQKRVAVAMMEATQTPVCVPDRNKSVYCEITPKSNIALDGIHNAHGVVSKLPSEFGNVHSTSVPFERKFDRSRNARTKTIATFSDAVSTVSPMEFAMSKECHVNCNEQFTISPSVSNYLEVPVNKDENAVKSSRPKYLTTELTILETTEFLQRKRLYILRARNAKLALEASCEATQTNFIYEHKSEGNNIIKKQKQQ
ncbi:hypothetical protein DPMN_057503 [Dreissena polymorpha]|uniref:Uncharacterized protein n=1 Tax=Dreissena polymorpha TaxID=45954 RepID=A0A9D4C0B1_DREPO|nr:hypothetical protein DPMN_057503 [Dreissena polymorpha]